MSLQAKFNQEGLEFKEGSDVKARILGSSSGIRVEGVSGASVVIKNVEHPTHENDAATKQYVDNLVSGVSHKQEVHVATTADLACTYAHGNAGGAGATLTRPSNGSVDIDGLTMQIAQRVLVKNQTNSFENGIYVVTNDGAAAPFELTRASDSDRSHELTGGEFVFIESGATQADSGQVMSESSKVLGSGTVSISRDSKVVTGSGTAFTTELVAFQAILIGSAKFTVMSIASDGELEIDREVVNAQSSVPFFAGTKLGVDPINFIRFSGTGLIVAGNAISRTGNQLDVNVDDATIEINGSDKLQLKNSGILTSHLSTGCVDTNALGSDCITSDKIADDQVLSEHIAAGAILEEHVSANSINQGALKTFCVTHTKIAPNSVTTTKIIDGAITSAKIASQTIVSGDVAPGTIENSRLENSTISGHELGTSLSTFDLTAGSSSIVLSNNSTYDGSGNVNVSVNTVQGIASSDSPSFAGLTVNSSVLLKNGNSSAGFADFYESSDNGTHFIRLIGQQQVEANLTCTLPSASGTLATTDDIANQLSTSSFTFTTTLPLHLGSNSTSQTVQFGDTVHVQIKLDEITLQKNASNQIEVVDGSISSAKIADLAVTSAKLASSSVIESKLATDSVSTVKIQDSAVTTSKIANLAVTSGKIANASITTDKYGENSITSSKIAAGTIANDRLANNTISGHSLGSTLSSHTISVGSNGLTIDNSGAYNGSASVSRTIQLPQALKNDSDVTFNSATLTQRLSVGTTTLESAVLAAAAIATTPTISGVHLGMASTAATVALVSGNSDTASVRFCVAATAQPKAEINVTNSNQLLEIKTANSTAMRIDADQKIYLNKGLVMDAQALITFGSFTTAERDAVGAPVAGDVLFDSTENRLSVYDGSSWEYCSGKKTHTIAVGSNGLQISGDSTYNGQLDRTTTLTLPQDLRTSASPTFVAVHTTSDATLKRNIQPLEPVLDRLALIEAKRFEWIDEIDVPGEQIGILAQDVERVFPEAVSEVDGKKRVDQSVLIGVLIKAVHDLSLKIERMQQA